MTRLMYDSVNPFAIPEHAQMVLVYVDGIFKWTQAGRDRFKHAKQVTCSAIGAVSAQVGDVEPGCIWPPENAVPWVQRARSDGYDPTVYVNERNDWAPTREAFRRAGVPEPHWLVANYNGVAQIPAGAVGRQYAHPSDPPGNPTGPWHTAGHWDESVVADYWPGVDTGEEDPMAGITIKDIEDAAFRSQQNFWRGMAVGVDPETYYAFNRVMLDHVVAPTVSRVPGAEVDEEALARVLATLLTPDLIATLQGLDLEGLDREQTIEAVHEALRRGVGA